MANTDLQRKQSSETQHSTKRVFMRAEPEDTIRTTGIISAKSEDSVPELFAVIKRELAYFGPKLRLEADSTGEMYLLTIPGPNSEAILWDQSDSGLEQVAEISVDFTDSFPKYDICLQCNEPLTTVEHRRRSVIGACTEV